VSRIHHHHVYFPGYYYPRVFGTYFHFPTLSVFAGYRYYDPYWYEPYWYDRWYDRYRYGRSHYYGSYGGYGYRGGVVIGDLRLKVWPRHAHVYVDGYFVGQVDDFDGTFQRLRLEEGPHTIEVRAPGYESLIFEVLILPGETVTYEGDLLPVP